MRLYKRVPYLTSILYSSVLCTYMYVFTMWETYEIKIQYDNLNSNLCILIKFQVKNTWA